MKPALSLTWDAGSSRIRIWAHSGNLVLVGVAAIVGGCVNEGRGRAILRNSPTRVLRVERCPYLAISIVLSATLCPSVRRRGTLA